MTDLATNPAIKPTMIYQSRCSMVMFPPPKKEAYQRNTLTSDSKSLLATLRTDAPLFKKVETLRWHGPTPAFAALIEKMKAPQLKKHCQNLMR
jgi:hypothetical protein